MFHEKPFLLGLVCLALASPAFAGLSTYSQLCPDSDPNFSSCSYGTGSGSSHSNSLIWIGDDTQRYEASASAIATGDLWRLTMDVSLTDYKRGNYVQNWQEEPDGPFAPGYYTYPTMAIVSATTTDEITIAGGTGVYALSYVFSLDGTLTTTDTSLAYPNFCASLSLPGAQTTSFGCKGPGDTIPTTFTLSYSDLLFGGPIIPTLRFDITGVLDPLFPSDVTPYGEPNYGPTVDTNGDDLVTVRYTGDFGSTIRLQKIVVTDSKGNPIDNLTFKSKNGYQYNVEGATQVPFSGAVPEPASMLLVLGGGVAGWLASRNRRATR